MATHPRLAAKNRTQQAGLFRRLVRLVLLLLPLALLLAASFRLPHSAARLLWLGALFQGLGCLLTVWTRQGSRESFTPALIMLYVIALGWLLFSATGRADWFLYVAQAL